MVYEANTQITPIQNTVLNVLLEFIPCEYSYYISRNWDRCSEYPSFTSIFRNCFFVDLL